MSGFFNAPPPRDRYGPAVHASSTFTVSDWTPADPPDEVGGAPIPTTAAPSGLAHMVKTFEGDLSGRSVTWFLGCMNQQTGEGSYAALEVVDGVLDGRSGTFNIVHAASTHGTDRYDELLTIVPGSGTGELAALRGSGRLVVDEDGTHRLDLDYTLD